MVRDRPGRQVGLVPTRSDVSAHPALPPAGGVGGDLPASLHLELVWRSGRLAAERLLAQRALSELSEVNEYAALRAASSLQLLALLTQTARASGEVTPELEAELAELTRDYLTTLVELTGTVNDALLATMRDLAQRASAPSAWDTVALWLRTH